MKTLEEILKLVQRIKMDFFGIEFNIRVETDNKNTSGGRIFIQIIYNAPCTKSKEVQEWHGRKWYLSEYMTQDEVIKTCYAAFKAAVEHEVMEGFKVDNITLFNPHINFEELLSISHKEIKRQ